MAEENVEDNEYKDHYRRVLMDMVMKRSHQGYLESEEAVEGVASASHTPSEGSHFLQPNSNDSSSKCDEDGSKTVTSLKRKTEMNPERTTFPRRFASFEEILEEETPGSDNLLIRNRRSPEGDQPSMIADTKGGESSSAGSSSSPGRSLITPEPSLVEVPLGNSKSSSVLPQQPEESKAEPGSNREKLKKFKAWKFLRGIKDAWSPR